MTAIWHVLILYRRLIGKEHTTRWPERVGKPSLPRPQGRVVWLHAASVGEAQTGLILLPWLEAIRAQTPFTLLFTSGTVSSATFLSTRLPDWAVHQFYPMDAQPWVTRFIDHWQPDAALWLESELWPSMIAAIKKRAVPLALINGRLSDRSIKRWSILPSVAKRIMSAFTLILTQTEQDAERFRKLGASHVVATGNLKYGAPPLSFDQGALSALETAIGTRKLLVWASTHNGEEKLAAEIHTALKAQHPDFLTIIAPRHPERRGEIKDQLDATGHSLLFRGDSKTLPSAQTDIYVADTLGELGLFYRLAPVAIIGRSFSLDGGGGHNPLEAAKLGAAVLAGPWNQNLQAIYDDMVAAQAATIAQTPQDLETILVGLYGNAETLETARARANDYAVANLHILDAVTEALDPFLKGILAAQTTGQ
jgi:3-deoxy-D-manno-octulosonic-acid transferase